MFMVDGEGNEVAAYTYDPFGKVLTATGTMAEINPLRYRGYYQDSETGFYYLQSRYYDPAICRFINADSYASTGQGLIGYNAFAYCLNNPVNYHDDDGKFGLLGAMVVGALIGVVGQYVGEVISNALDGKSGADLFRPTGTIADYTSAAISGALAATGIGAGASILVNAGLSTVTYLVDCGIKNTTPTSGELAWAVLGGALSGAVGGSGANAGKQFAAFDVAGDVIANTFSPKKAAMYAAKRVVVRNSIAVAAARTFVSVGAPNVIKSIMARAKEWAE